MVGKRESSTKAANVIVRSAIPSLSVSKTLEAH
jgi:hypothetical protein